MRRKILFYSDSPVFGGHEEMTILLANTVAEEYSVDFLYHHVKIGEKLSDKVNKKSINVISRFPLAGFRTFHPREKRYLKRIMTDLKPDLIIISQGDIEFGIQGAKAARALGIPVISYIPLCIPFSAKKDELGKLRDFFYKRLWGLFDSFITISEYQKKNLLRRLKSPKLVSVLENLVLFPDNVVLESQPQSTVLRIGLIGRIEMKHKGHDMAVRIAEKLAARGVRFVIRIIGEGGDRDKLAKMIQNAGLASCFEFTGWIKDKKALYENVDVVLMTSRYEGVPLVMLESLYLGRPVVAFLNEYTKIYTEYLSREFLFDDVEQAVDLLAQFGQKRERFYELWPGIRKNIEHRHGLSAFQQNALNIVKKYLGKTETDARA